MATSLARQQTLALTRRTVTPNSALLQELLEEQRGRRASQTNSPTSEDSKSSLEDRQVRSSPTGKPTPQDSSSSNKQLRRSSDPSKGLEVTEAEAKKNKAVGLSCPLALASTSLLRSARTSIRPTSEGPKHRDSIGVTVVVAVVRAQRK